MAPPGRKEDDPGWQYLRRTVDQIMADQSKKFDPKKDVWVPDPEEGFVAAEMKSSKGDQTTVLVVGGSEKTLKTDLVQPMNPPKFEKAEDMSNLSQLNEAAVLHNLRSRYGAMLIYTYSGLFCVVINPYKRLPIYTESVVRMFMGKRRNEMPPHLFAVADTAFRNMLQDHMNQSMLITGESGAGKTENTKKVISYFAILGASQQAKVDDGKKKVSLEDQIVQMNPVLEAYGNAKTVRNNNSSRFGKFIRMHFSGAGKLAGCDIEHYLLEKSRVVKQAAGERCYHIFYQMFHVPGLKETLKLTKDVSEYSFVNQAELTINGIDDVEEGCMTDEAFDVLQFEAPVKKGTFQVTAGIMLLGQLKWKQRPREEQAEADGTDEAALCCANFNIDSEQFVTAILKPKVKVGAEWVAKGQNLEQARM